jgi:hypothetical protein
MAKRDVPGIGDLMLVARQLGYKSSKEARQVLKINGVKGKFDPSKFDEYVAILTTHARTLTSILNKLDTPHNMDLPARAERVLRAQGQQPWLLRPVAKDERGMTRFINDVEELKKNETLVYEGVTKNEFLDRIAEMEKEDAVDTGKPTPDGV